MGNIGAMLQEMRQTISKPFSEEITLSQFLLLLGLFIIIAFIVVDMISILNSWVKHYAPAV